MIILGRNLVLQSVLAETQQGHKLAPIYSKCSGILPIYRNVKAGGGGGGGGGEGKNREKKTSMILVKSGLV